MIATLSTAVIVVALVFSAVVLVYVALARDPDWGLLAAAVLLEVGTLVLVVAAAVVLARGDHQLAAIDATTYFGYLATALCAPPLGFLWALSERSRAATAVLAAAGVTHAFLVLRTMQVWQG